MTNSIIENSLSNGEKRPIVASEVFVRQTEVQLIRVVYSKDFGYMLFLDSELQVATVDEHVYHDHLVRPVMEYAAGRGEVKLLILGGGDGFALRDALRFKRVARVILVDHDRELVQLFSEGQLGNIFGTSKGFADSRVHCAYCDAQAFLGAAGAGDWNVIIVDLTDNCVSTELEDLLASIGATSCNGALVSMNLGPLDGDGERQLARIESGGVAVVEAYRFCLASYGEPWLCAFGVMQNRRKPEQSIG